MTTEHGKGRPVEDLFGLRVRTLREKRGWTQAELARRLADTGLKLHPSAIAKIEDRDARTPRSVRLSEATAIAHALGTTVDEMTGGTEESWHAAWDAVVAWLEDMAAQRAEGETRLRTLVEELTFARPQGARYEPVSSRVAAVIAILSDGVVALDRLDALSRMMRTAPADVEGDDVEEWAASVEGELLKLRHSPEVAGRIDDLVARIDALFRGGE